jgi:FKBP-type peptidyl-prolyl cis-trans isomerase
MKFWIVSIILIAFIVSGVAFFANPNTISSNQNKSSFSSSSVSAPNLFSTNSQNSQANTSNLSSSMPNTSTSSNTSELQIQDLVMGTGAEVVSGDTITIHYSGTLLNGTKFDSSYDRGQPFSTRIGVGQVIQGWDKGIIGMKIGGKRKLTIPAELAYGSRAIGSIPANSTLVFETELISIQGK